MPRIITTPDLENILERFKNEDPRNLGISAGTVNSYCVGMRRIHDLRAIDIVQSFRDVINSTNVQDAEEDLIDRVTEILDNSNLTPKEKNDFGSAFKKVLRFYVERHRR